MRTSPCLCAFISGGSAREANPVCIYEFWRGGKKSAKTEVWQALYLSLRDSLPVHLYLYYTHISAVFSLSFIRAGTHTDIPRSAYGSTGSPAHRTNQSHTRWRTPTSPLCPLGRRCRAPPLAAALPTATPLTHRSRSDTYMNRGSPARSHLLPPIKIKPLGPSTLRSIALSAAPAQAGAAMYGLSSSLSAWSSRVATSALTRAGSTSAAPAATRAAQPTASRK